MRTACKKPLGQDAIHGDQRRPGVVGDFCRYFQASKIETAADRPGEKVTDSIWKHRNLILVPWEFLHMWRRGFDWKLSGEYFGLPEIGFPPQDRAGFVSFYWPAR